MKLPFAKWNVKVLGVIAPLLATVLLYQNCGKSGFKVVDRDGLSLGSTALAVVPPEVSIVSTVPPISNSKSLSINIGLIAGTDPSVVATYTLDNGTPQVISGLSISLSNLSDGDHKVIVSAMDSKGLPAVEKVVTFRTDATMPVVTISQAPASVSANTTASIVFGATDNLSGVASLQCSLEGAAFAICQSPLSLSNMSAGAHTVDIRAMDMAGNMSQVQKVSWTVDLTAPTVSISTILSQYSKVKSQSFSFSGSSSGVAINSFQCSIDGSAFAACVSPKAYTNLGEGAHTFSLRGTNANGVNSSPASVQWLIDSVLPTTPEIVSNVGAQTELTTVSLMFSSSDAGSMIASYQCSMNNSAFAACTSPKAYTGLMEGTHNFRVKSFDNAGNESAIGSFSWMVKAPPAPNLDGADLYLTNCAACHGQLANSTKKDRTAVEITNAITNQPTMANIKLTAAQISAVAAVLKSGSSNSLSQKFACLAPANRGKSDVNLRRLTTPEIRNTLEDLVGAGIVADSQVQAQLAQFNDDILMQDPTEISTDVPFAHGAALLEIADRIGELSFANTTNRNAIYSTCGANPTATCVQSFVTSFGLKVFRRPLTAAESSSFMALYNSSAGQEGLKQVLMKMLMSPPMIFHMEADGVVVSGRVKLTSYEVASRLSYRLTGTTPDATLLQAAANNQLSTVAQVQAQAKRILSTAKAKARINDFFKYYLQTQKVAIADPYAPTGALNGINTVGLGAELETEFVDFISNVIWTKNGKFSDLLTSREVIPRTDRVAKILGVNRSTSVVPTSEGHAGLLLRPALLSTTKKSTAIMHRGAVYRKRILCETLGTPDAAAVAAQEATVTLDPTKVGNRDIATAKTNVASCLGCHSKINPIGFVLEGYDQLGMIRSSEALFNAANVQTASVAINTQVENPGISNADGPISSLKDASELVSATLASHLPGACFSQMIFEYQRARALTADDFCALSEIEASVKNNSVSDAIVNAIANEDIFYKAQGS
jgi:cytochrome c553